MLQRRIFGLRPSRLLHSFRFLSPKLGKKSMADSKGQKALNLYLLLFPVTQWIPPLFLLCVWKGSDFKATNHKRVPFFAMEIHWASGCFTL